VEGWTGSKPSGIDGRMFFLNLPGAGRHGTAGSKPAAPTRMSCRTRWSGLIRWSAMIKAPPCDQKNESADDSKNKPFRHFFAYPICMPQDLMNYDLSQGGLVTNNSSLITMNPVCINRPGEPARHQPHFSV